MSEQIIKKNKEGLYYRPNTSDTAMLADSKIGSPKSDYATVDPAGKVVMDLGANIGGFCVRAEQLGAKQVVCYEPLPSNIEVLKLNTANTKIKVVEKCVIGSDKPTITFYLNNSKLAHCSASIKKKSKATEYVVPAVNFWDELQEIKPELIKMDIEGAEYEVLSHDLPNFVKELAIEIHFSSNENRAKSIILIENLKRQFGEPIFEKDEIVFEKPVAVKMHFKR
jgi:FkbM family methyltransferase